MTSLIAVALTLVTSCLFILFRELILASCGLRTGMPTRNPSGAENAQIFQVGDDEDLDQSEFVRSIAGGRMTAVIPANDPLEVGMVLLTERGESVKLRYDAQANPSHERNRKVDKAITATFAIPLAPFFFGAAGMGVVWAGIANNTVASSDSPDCGD